MPDTTHDPDTRRAGDPAIFHGAVWRPIHVLQPALPHYRIAFFDRVDGLCGGALTVYYSHADMGVLTDAEVPRNWAKIIGAGERRLGGAVWQDGAVSVPLGRGDVLVVFGNPRYLSTLLLIAKARLRGARVVWWGHYWSSTSKAWRHGLRLLLMKVSDAYLFYTESEVTEYKTVTAGALRKPVAGLNNGLDLGPIRPCRATYHAASRQKRLLFIGRLTEKAQLHVALEALARTEDRDISLDVIGDSAQAPRLRTLAEELGLAERVRWHPATRVEARIALIANACRVFIYPGEVGLSLIHAMAYGLPAVVHGDRKRHMPEFAAFDDGRTGWSFRRNDAADLARVLDLRMSATAELDQCSEAATQVAETQFNTDMMAARFVALIQSLSEGLK